MEWEQGNPEKALVELPMLSSLSRTDNLVLRKAFLPKAKPEMARIRNEYLASEKGYGRTENFT